MTGSDTRSQRPESTKDVKFHARSTIRRSTTGPTCHLTLYKQAHKETDLSYKYISIALRLGVAYVPTPAKQGWVVTIKPINVARSYLPDIDSAYPLQLEQALDQVPHD